MLTLTADLVRQYVAENGTAIHSTHLSLVTVANYTQVFTISLSIQYQSSK